MYKEEVDRKIQITDDELREAYIKNHVRVHIRHLFTKDSLRIKSWQKLLAEGASFEMLAKQFFRDSVLANNGGDLGWVTLWDLDDDIAVAVQNLHKMQISERVKTKWGFHIIQLLNREDDVLLLEEDYLVKRKTLEKKIKRKRSQELANLYISQFMKKTNPQPNPKVLYNIWEIISGGKEQGRRIPFTILFTKELINSIELKLQTNLNEPLVYYYGGEITLGEYIAGLKEIPISNRPRIKNLKQLSNSLGIWVRDMFLLEEAYRQGIETRLAVKKELLEFTERQCYLHYLN